MKKIRAIIIEDEKLARDLIKEYMQDIDNIELVGESPDGFSGLKAISELKPDLIFLDIQMPKISGFEMLELIEVLPHIIFTTAYDQYAIKAFEMNAVDYLLKPFSKERFDLAIEKVIDRINLDVQGEEVKKLVEHFGTSEELLDRVVVKKGSKIIIIPVDQINYIESQDDYVMIHSSSGNFLKQRTMNYFETHLDNSVFIRIHRSYIVRINQISQMELYEKDSYILILKTGDKLRVSKTGYKNLKKVLKF